MFAGIVLCFLLLAGCSSKQAEVRIAVGGQGTQINLPAMLAQELGFYKEAGLNVSLVEYPGGAKALEAMMGGSADLVCGSYDHTIEMAAQGVNLRAFVAMLDFPGMVLVSPNIASIAGLRGKAVGVTTLGSESQMLLNYLLIKHGMKPDDVSTAAIGSSATAVGAVAHNKVDAAIMTDPALAIVRKQMPGLHILADMQSAEGARSVFGVEHYLATVLYSKAKWVETNRDTAKRLADAIIRTLAWLRTHKPEEIRERVPASLRTQDAQIDIEVLRTTQTMLSSDGRFTPDAAGAVRDVVSASLETVRNSRIDLAKTYTNEMIP